MSKSKPALYYKFVPKIMIIITSKHLENCKVALTSHQVTFPYSRIQRAGGHLHKKEEDLQKLKIT